MNKLFKNSLNILLVLIIGLLIIPFLSIIQKGFSFIVSLPYPKETVYALKLSVKTGLISSTLCTVLTVVVSHAIEIQTDWGKNVIDYLMSLPLTIPHLVTGLALLSFFGQKGIGRYLLENFGIDFVYTVPGIILAQFFVNLPYSLKTYGSFYEMIDDKMLFSARNLGLNEFQVFIHVVIPMLKRQILCNWIMNFSRALGEFGAVMMLVGVTRMKTETLATSIFLNMSVGEFDVAAGTSVLLIFVSILVTFLNHIILKDDIKNVEG